MRTSANANAPQLKRKKEDSPDYRQPNICEKTKMVYQWRRCLMTCNMYWVIFDCTFLPFCNGKWAEQTLVLYCSPRPGHTSHRTAFTNDILTSFNSQYRISPPPAKASLNFPRCLDLFLFLPLSLSPFLSFIATAWNHIAASTSISNSLIFNKVPFPVRPRPNPIPGTAWSSINDKFNIRKAPEETTPKTENYL